MQRLGGQARDSRDKMSVTQPSAPASMEHTTQGCHLVFFDFLNMNSPVIFAGALTIFAGALPRGPHPDDRVERMILSDLEWPFVRRMQSLR